MKTQEEIQKEKMAGITISLSPARSEEFFHSALCNGGLSELSGSGLDFDYTSKDYDKAKKSLEAKRKSGEFKEDTICREDVWLEILRIGGKLKMIDTEDDDKVKAITLKEVHERVAQMPFDHLADYINENDDAITAYVLLQQVFLNDQIF